MWEIRLAEGTYPVEAIRAAASAVALARIELARLRLEDVFIRLVTEEPDAESEQALRANLQGLAGEASATC